MFSGGRERLYWERMGYAMQDSQNVPILMFNFLKCCMNKNKTLTFQAKINVFMKLTVYAEGKIPCNIWFYQIIFEKVAKLKLEEAYDVGQEYGISPSHIPV